MSALGLDLNCIQALVKRVPEKALNVERMLLLKGSFT